MRNIYRAIVVSFLLHAIFICGIVGWSMYDVIPGGEKGFVEVGLVGDGDGLQSVVSKKNVIPAKAGIQKLSKMLDPRRSLPSNDLVEGGDDEIDKSREKNKSNNQENSSSSGSGPGEGGGLGGAGQGPDDPRLVKIRQKINRKKYYPEFARRQGLEGSPKVSFSIGLGGSVNNVKIVNSSGHDLLDQAALKTINQSAPLPFYPKPIIIAVKYALDK